jgi:hypothetical protein
VKALSCKKLHHSAIVYVQSVSVYSCSPLILLSFNLARGLARSLCGILQITFIDDYNCNFVLSNTDASIANALRKAIISEISTNRTLVEL